MAEGGHGLRQGRSVARRPDRPRGRPRPGPVPPRPVGVDAWTHRFRHHFSDESTDLPPVLGAAVTGLVDRASKVRRTRRQTASLPRDGARPVEQGTDREFALSLPAVGSRCKAAKSPGTRALRCHVLSQASASLTYGVRLTCIGNLVVKVTTLGRAGLADPYATTPTP
jgi:hypothetical protein